VVGDRLGRRGRGSGLHLLDLDRELVRRDRFGRGLPGLVQDRAGAVLDRGGLPEPGGEALLERVELALVDLTHREHHDEQHHQQRDHVGVGDQPALVVLVLLVLLRAACDPSGRLRLGLLAGGQ